jgi:hypothetical protein
VTAVSGGVGEQMATPGRKGGGDVVCLDGVAGSKEKAKGGT